MTNYVVTSGQTSTLNLVNGDFASVSFGGTELGGSIGSGAILTNSGVVSGATEAVGGSLTVFGGGVTSGVVMLSASAPTSQFAIENVSLSGLAVGTVLNSSDVLMVSGSATSTVVNAGGFLQVISGGVETGATLSGTQAGENVSAGAIANLDQVSSSGVLNVFGGSASGTSVGIGGSIQLSSGGTVTSATLTGSGNSGGAATIFAAAGTTVLGTQVSSGGATNIYGSASGTAVFASGFEFVSSGGTATAAQLGGTLVTSGGTTTINSGVQTVFTSGTTISTQIGQAGKEVLSGGTAWSTVVTSGGGLVVSSGGVAIGATISGGMVLSSGGIPFTSASFETISSGGTTSNTTIGSGAILNVKSVGNVLGMTIGSGGSAYISAGATTSGIVVSGGMLVIRAATVSGAQVSSGGLEVVSSAGSATNTTIGNGGTLQVNSAGGINSATLLSGATLDLSTFTFVSSGLGSLNSSSDLLTISQGGASATVQLVGDYTNLYFSMVQDGGTGTAVVVQGTPCYCRGTLILTDEGERPVETLAIGDRLITHTGASRPIRWIGRRSYAGRFANCNPGVLPVCFKAGALGHGVPRRDLFVSPLHAMFIDGALVPAALLVNGCSIVQAEQVDQVEYIHLELDTHDVIWAEGAASETFIDDGSRGMFHNAAEYAAMYPAAEQQEPSYCAPRLEGGDALEAVKRHLVIPPRDRKVIGRLDTVSRDRLGGWAWCPDGQPVQLCIACDGVVLGTMRANEWRPDLAAAGFGDGHCGFSLVIPGGLAAEARLVEVSTPDGHALPGSPWVLHAAA